MAQAQVFENKQPVLGINSLGRIGKLTLWHHIGRKYFKEIIVNQLNVNEEQITPTASFLDDLGADSLDTVELIMAFEEEFGIDIPDDDVTQLKTVGDAVTYIKNKQG